MINPNKDLFTQLRPHHAIKASLIVLYNTLFCYFHPDGNPGMLIAYIGAIFVNKKIVNSSWIWAVIFPIMFGANLSPDERIVLVLSAKTLCAGLMIFIVAANEDEEN